MAIAPEHIDAVRFLDDDEALKLFVKVVGEQRAAAEPEAAAELLDPTRASVVVESRPGRAATASKIRSPRSKVNEGTAPPPGGGSGGGAVAVRSLTIAASAF